MKVVISNFIVGKEYYREVPYKKWFKRVQTIIITERNGNECLVSVDDVINNGIVESRIDYNHCVNYEVLMLNDEVICSYDLLTACKTITDSECGDRKVADLSAINLGGSIDV